MALKKIQTVKEDVRQNLSTILSLMLKYHLIFPLMLMQIMASISARGKRLQMTQLIYWITSVSLYKKNDLGHLLMLEWDLKVKRLEVAMLSSLGLICAQVKGFY